MYILRDKFDEEEAERCRLRKQRRDGELAKQEEIELRQREELADWEELKSKGK